LPDEAYEYEVESDGNSVWYFDACDQSGEKPSYEFRFQKTR
jgi:hypothetical protein